MAEPKTESKVSKVPISPEPEGLVTSWMNHSAELAERATNTGFGIIRDVRGEINQRILATLSLVESSQMGVMKLLRTIDERVDKLAEQTIDTAESLTLGVIRALRETGHGVTVLAGGLTRPREISRAA
jgi:hypothetical protein